MKNLGMKIAMEFKKQMELENENGKAGNNEQATYHMTKKWEASSAAEHPNVVAEFNKALKDLGV